MLNISVENYKNEKVYAITIDNRELFWVKMKVVKKGLSIKNISDLVKKEIFGVYGTKNPRKEQIRKY